MATPTEKYPVIDSLLKSMFGVDRRDSIVANTCTLCRQPAVEFRDIRSHKEFRISGFCQACQDKAWLPGGEGE